MSQVPERIELLRRRKFGEVLGDTFAFIRLNLAVILKVHLLLSLPIILVTAGIFLLAFRDHFSLLHTVDSGPFVDSVAWRDDMTTWGIGRLFAMLALIPVSTNTFLVVDRYQRSATGKVTFEEVWALARKKYLPVLAAKLLMAPIIFFTGLLLIIPGIVFYTLFLCVELLIIQHNFGVIRAIGRSSQIMGKFFWGAFGANILFLLVYLLFTSLMHLPVSIAEEAAELSTDTIDLDNPWALAALSFRVFNTIIGYVIYTIPTVAMALMYFSIREESSQATIMERIRAIGTEKKKRQHNEYSLGDEQY